MIGQKQLQEKLHNLIINKTFPRFTILVGGQGSGRKTIATDFIVNEFKQSGYNILTYILPDIKVDTIREMIDQAYSIDQPIIYLIPDADTMSEGAKNAMLKVTEEPPNNAYFIMTLHNESNTLTTIRSRATIFHLDPYTQNDILAFCDVYGITDHDSRKIIALIAETPLEVMMLKDYNAREFYDYVTLVVDNIATVSGANSFKIGNKLDLSGDINLYDLRLFWKTFEYICFERLSNQKDNMYLKGIITTCKYLSQFRTVSINKTMLFDMWLLDIRQEWLNYADD